MSQEEEVKDAGTIEAAARERSGRFARLVASHGVDTLLVSVPRVARMLGYAPSTLYGYIKAGTFFLPYRVVNGSPAVAVDDLIDWLSSRDSEIAPRGPSASRKKAGDPGEESPNRPAETWRARAERKALAAAARARPQRC